MTERARDLGLRSKLRRNRKGDEIGDRPFGRGQLHYLLTNPVYIGRVRHKTTDHPGQHPAIIEDGQWQRVQLRLQQQAGRVRGQQQNGEATALLLGKLTDEIGDRLTPTQTTKGRRRYRYYVSNRLISGPADPAASRLPARMLEVELAAGIRDHLCAGLQEHRLLVTSDIALHQQVAARLRAFMPTTEGPSLPASEVARALSLLTEGRIASNQIDLTLSRDGLAEVMAVDPAEIGPEILNLHLPVKFERRRIGAKIVIGTRTPQPNLRLVSALIRAHRWLAALREGKDITRLAKGDGISEGCLRGHLQLAFLAPAIQAAILDGSQPEHLTVNNLTRPEMPSDWDAQYRRTGIFPA